MESRHLENCPAIDSTFMLKQVANSGLYFICIFSSLSNFTILQKHLTGNYLKTKQKHKLVLYYQSTSTGLDHSLYSHVTQVEIPALPFTVV